MRILHAHEADPSPLSVLVRYPAEFRTKFKSNTDQHVATMISDRDLFSIAIFLGGASMMLVVLYHFLEASASPDMDKAK